MLISNVNFNNAPENVFSSLNFLYTFIDPSSRKLISPSLSSWDVERKSQWVIKRFTEGVRSYLCCWRMRQHVCQHKGIEPLTFSLEVPSLTARPILQLFIKSPKLIMKRTLFEPKQWPGPKSWCKCWKWGTCCHLSYTFHCNSLSPCQWHGTLNEGFI